MRHAYGEDDDVPALVAALDDVDDATRADARRWLRACLCHQRTRYPATLAALPALAAHRGPERAFVLDLFADVAVGDADAWVLGAADLQAEDPLIGAITAHLRRLRLPHDDPDPAIRSRAARLALVLGGAVPAADDVDAGVRAARALAVPERRHLDDPDRFVAAAAAFRFGDVATAAQVAAAPGLAGSSPWLGGDAGRLAVEALVLAGAAEPLLRTLEVGAPAHAARATLPALLGASRHLAPKGGWTPETLPPTLRRVIEALLERPAMATPEVWVALRALGVAADEPRSLYPFVGRAPPRSRLAVRPWIEVAKAVRGGSGGPTVLRRIDGMTVRTVSRSGVYRGTQRALAATSLAAHGAAAVSVVVELCEEAGATLEGLRHTFDRIVAADPAGVKAASAAASRDRLEPAVLHDVRGEVVFHTAQVALVGLHARACAATGEPPDPAVTALAPACTVDEVFFGELLALLRVCAPDQLEDLARRLITDHPGACGGALLAAVLAALPDADVVRALPHLDPGLVVEGLAPRRVPALAGALAARVEGFLAERRRWMRESVSDEVERLGAQLRAKGPAALRALRAAADGPLTATALGGASALPAPAQKAAVPSSSAAEASAQAIVDIVLKEPLLGWLLGSLERVFTDVTPTIGLRVRPGQRLALLVNPTYFLSLPKRVRAGAVRHEVLHLVLGHPFRSSTNLNAYAFGTAADLVCNEHSAGWPLPDDARRHPYGRPPTKPGETVDALYAQLLVQALTEHTHEHQAWHSDHHFWHQWPGEGDLSVSDLSDAARGWDRSVTDGVGALGADGLWGLEPGVRGAVLGSVERHRTGMDWRRVLRAFAAGSRRTSVKHTLRRRSRRYGTFPGIAIQRHHRLAVAIDTSGSVSDELLRVFFGEIAAIHAARSEVVVVECDAAVHRVWAYRGIPPEEVHGRGGTEFEPVMKWLRTPDAGSFDALVYLTDGCGPAPVTRPPCPVLWVITPGGTIGPALRFGRAVRMPPLAG